MSRLNAVVVCFDTLRRDALATDLCRTPSFDRFAAEAVSYTNAWGEGLPTIPFRRAAFTGRRSFPWRHQVGDRGSFPHILGWHAIPEAHTTLAEYLYLRGYATGLVSDLWHMFQPTMNFTRGFVSWEFIRGQEADTYTISRDSLQEPSPYGGRRVAPADYLYQTRNRRRDDDYFAARLFDTAAEWVEGNVGNSPYFLWVDCFTPHEFWDPPVRFADAYAPGGGRRDYLSPQTLNAIDGRPAPDPRDVERTRALYRGSVSFADERFGRFLDRLERCGALRDTVVMVLSDHGTELWDKGRFGKAADRLYRYNTQINWLVRHPDHACRQEVDAFVQNQDVVPTLLDLLGIPRPPLDGRTVWPWPQRPAELPERDHVISAWGTNVSVREARWLLLLNAQDLAVPPRLYDTATDPAEDRNVAAAHPEVVAPLVGRLEEFLGMPLPAQFDHRPGWGPNPTTRGLLEIRRRLAERGERWEGGRVEE